MAKGYLQGARESVPGYEFNTPTLSTKTVFFALQTFNPTLNPTVLDRDDELRNTDEPLPVSPDSYAPAWEIDQRAYPDQLGFLFSVLFGIGQNYTVTTGNGVITDPDAVAIPTGAFKHVWTAPFGPAGISPSTMQLIAAYLDPNNVFYKLKGAAVQQLDLTTPSTGGVQVKATGPALFYDRIADPSLSPVLESVGINPFKKLGFTFTGLSSTSNYTDATLVIANPVQALDTLGVASRYPDLMEKGDSVITFTGQVTARDITSTDWDALKNATTFGATYRWLSDTFVTGSYPYKLYAAMPACQYIGGDADNLDNKRHHGGQYNFKAVNNGSASATVTLINSTASYV